MVRVCHLFISPGHNYFGHHDEEPGAFPTIEVAEIECVAGRGIRNDRFFDFKENYKGQVTFFSMDVFDQLQCELDLPHAHPGATRRNVFVRGVELNTLIGAEFEIQGVRFAGIQHCAPCHWMDHALGAGAEHFLQMRGGLRARILTTGFVRREQPGAA